MASIVSPVLDYRREFAEKLLQDDGLRGLDAWYRERLTRLGDMTVTDAPLTDGTQWRATLAASPDKTNVFHALYKRALSALRLRPFHDQIQVGRVEGAHFTLEGREVTKYKPDSSADFQWTQPGLFNNEQEITLPTPSGDRKVKVSGFVGIIVDQNQNVLLTLAQEPFTVAPKHGLIRTPFQTSATKLQGLLEGRRELDPTLHDLLHDLGRGKSIQEMLTDGTMSAFPLSPADANRIEASNIGFTLNVTDPELHKKLEGAEGQNRWFTPDEVKNMARAGLLNGHTAAAILAAQGQWGGS